VHGTQTHASISDQVPSVNASVKMAWVLWRMERDLRLSHQPHEMVRRTNCHAWGQGRRRSRIRRAPWSRGVRRRRAARSGDDT
jgi:hypothetical protein